MEELPLELLILKSFHGHLGPYVILGYMMGKIAREKFPDKIYANVYTGTKPPLSCLVDGIQMSSCCTLGKGNITLHTGGFPMATFNDDEGSKLMIELKADIREKVDSEMSLGNEEQRALELYAMSSKKLFNSEYTPVNRSFRRLIGKQ